MTRPQIDIEDLVRKELPPLPSSALRVSSLLQDANASTRAVAETIGHDPALAARILRAANSPLYALERNVTSLPAAVIALGNQTLQALALVSAAADAFGKTSKRLPGAKKLWEHSILTGLVARELSAALGMRGTDEAFVCGLLHDMGKLPMLQHDPEACARADARAAVCDDELEALMIEQESFGYTHAQVGALICKRWGLPEGIGYAVLSHHHPSEAPQQMFMARLIDVANQLANAPAEEGAPDEGHPLAAAESSVTLHLTAAHLRASRAAADSKLGEILACFT